MPEKHARRSDVRCAVADEECVANFEIPLGNIGDLTFVPIKQFVNSSQLDHIEALSLPQGCSLARCLLITPVHSVQNMIEHGVQVGRVLS